MKWLIKGAFRPIDNRHYNPRHRLHYILINAPGFLVILALGIFANPWLFLWLLVFPFDYFVLDRASDRFWWNFLWSRFYKDENRPLTDHEQVMKAYEQNPTPENLKKLHQVVKKG